MITSNTSAMSTNGVMLIATICCRRPPPPRVPAMGSLPSAADGAVRVVQAQGLAASGIVRRGLGRAVRDAFGREPAGVDPPAVELLGFDERGHSLTERGHVRFDVAELFLRDVVSHHGRD